MISGSSEQLLEQQQQELRNRKLKELAPKKKVVPRKVSWRERLGFYATSTLAFFSVTAGASLLFLVPLYVDPAIATLTWDFIEAPTWCRTIRRDDVVGLMNCSWSSCREGCTSDLYRCTHIYVSFIEATNETLYGNLSNAITNAIDNDIDAARSLMVKAARTIENRTENIEHSEEAILLVNIKGCGYPPKVVCENFSSLYGEEGAVFPCYYSRTNRTLVMTSYNRSDQWSMILNFFFVPFIITVISSIGLCVMHCDCSCRKEHGHRQRQREREFERDQRQFCRRARNDNLR